MGAMKRNAVLLAALLVVNAAMWTLHMLGFFSLDIFLVLLCISVIIGIIFWQCNCKVRLQS